MKEATIQKNGARCANQRCKDHQMATTAFFSRFIFRCPECGWNFCAHCFIGIIEENNGGRQAQCPNPSCQTKILLPTPAALATAA